MLIRFSVENFLSYKEPQIFSMVAGKQTKHRDHLVEVKGKRLLKGSFLFGANAAGKSNLFEAIRFSRYIVLKGVRKNVLTNKHFRVADGYANKPGVFQFDIYSNGHFYSYGFAISYIKASVEEEWLYLCDSAERTIFERSIENGEQKITTDFKFSDDEQSQKFKVFSENVADDKLLLSEIAERKLIDHPDFSAYKDVRAWFNSLIVILPESNYVDKIRMLSEDKEYNLTELLRDFDTGIEDIALVEQKMEESLGFLPEKMRAEIIQDLEASFNEEDPQKGKPQEIEVNIAGRSLNFKKDKNLIFASQLMMNHGNKNDLFELGDESDGTQRLFDLIPVYREGKKPRVILVDELDRSFHTKLVFKYIEQFYQFTGGIESQLIASVHDSNVMDLDLLRQDEIWFVERQEDHSSKLYSLNKFQERFDKKVAKDYLLGRYGAIPCFSQMSESRAEDE